jgi:hypothetical protein
MRAPARCRHAGAIASLHGQTRHRPGRPGGGNFHLLGPFQQSAVLAGRCFGDQGGHMPGPAHHRHRSGRGFGRGGDLQPHMRLARRLLALGRSCVRPQCRHGVGVAHPWTTRPPAMPRHHRRAWPRRFCGGAPASHSPSPAPARWRRRFCHPHASTSARARACREICVTGRCICCPHRQGRPPHGTDSHRSPGTRPR